MSLSPAVAISRISFSLITLDATCSDGLVAHSTHHSMTAMAQAEVDAEMPFKRGFALVVVVKLWHLGDAVLVTQGTMQQPVGCHTKALINFLPVA